MFSSFEERLATFESWPQAYKPDFVRKLAFLGQYSLKDQNLSTCCIYCKKRLEDWQVSEDPFTEHLNHQINCPLFKINSKNSKMAFIKASSFSKKSKDYIDCLMKLPFIIVSIKPSSDVVCCAKCGFVYDSSTADSLLLSNHKCKFKYIQRPTTANLSKSDKCQFYIRLFSGHIGIDQYLESEVYIPKKEREVFDFLINAVEVTPFETVKSFIERASPVFVERISKRLKSIEAKAFKEHDI